MVVFKIKLSNKRPLFDFTYKRGHRINKAPMPAHDLNDIETESSFEITRQ